MKFCSFYVKQQSIKKIHIQFPEVKRVYFLISESRFRDTEDGGSCDGNHFKSSLVINFFTTPLAIVLILGNVVMVTNTGACLIRLTPRYS